MSVSSGATGLILLFNQPDSGKFEFHSPIICQRQSDDSQFQGLSGGTEVGVYQMHTDTHSFPSEHLECVATSGT